MGQCGDNTTSYNFTEEIGGTWETLVESFRRHYLILLFLRFNAPFTCIPSGCCTKEGSPKASEGLTEDDIGTEVVTLFTKVMCFAIKNTSL